jgi:hypothetical protein
MLRRPEARKWGSDRLRFNSTSPLWLKLRRESEGFLMSDQSEWIFKMRTDEFLGRWMDGKGMIINQFHSGKNIFKKRRKSPRGNYKTRCL